MNLQRISTGIIGLDSWLCGGLIKGRSYLVTGDAGTGKTTACMQFLLGALAKGEKAVYVTVDERPTEIVESAVSLGWDLQSHVNEKRLVILDASPYFGGRAAVGLEKGVDLQKIVADLSGYAKRLEASRLVIDPVTPLILPADSTNRAPDLARTFIHLIQSQFETTNLFTAHLPAAATHHITLGIEEFLASGVFVLRVIQTDNRFIRTLTVKKMRSTAVEPNECPFVIVHERGIVLDGDRPGPVSEPGASDQTLEFFELPKKEK
jgi:circadian clock protein KaiC